MTFPIYGKIKFMFQTTDQIYCGISSPIVMNYDSPQFDKYLLASISTLIIRGVGHCGIPNLLPLGRTCRSTCRSTNSFLRGAKCRTMSGRRPNMSLALQRVVSHLLLLIWLVVSTPLKNISQWEGLSHFLWKIKNV